MDGTVTVNGSGADPMRTAAHESGEQRSDGEATYLATMTTILSDATSVPDIFTKLTDRLVPELADCCVFDLMPVAADRSSLVKSDTSEQPETDAVTPTIVLERTIGNVADPSLAELTELLAKYSIRLDDPTSLIAHVIRTGRAVFVRDIFDVSIHQVVHDETLLSALQRFHIRSVGIVPIVATGHVFGAMTLVRTHEREPFSLDDLGEAELVAAELARALDRTRAMEAEQEARAESERAQHHLTVFDEASVALGSATDGFDSVGHYARLLVPSIADGVWIHVREPGGADRVVELASLVTGDEERHGEDRHAAGLRQSVAELFAYREPSDPRSWPERVMAHSEPVIIRPHDVDGEHDQLTVPPALRTMTINLGLSGVVGLPLRSADGGVVGCLTLVRMADHSPFDHDDVALAKELADRLVHALDFRTNAQARVEGVEDRAATERSHFERDEHGHALLRSEPDRSTRFSKDGYVREYRYGPHGKNARGATTNIPYIPDVLPTDAATRVHDAIQAAIATKIPQGIDLKLPTVSESLEFEVRIARSGSDEDQLSTRHVTQQRRAETLMLVMAEANSVLSLAHDAQDSLQRALNVLVPTLADWCTVHLVEKDGTVKRVAFAESGSEYDRLPGNWSKLVGRIHRARATAISRYGYVDFFPSLASLRERAATTDPRLGHLLLRLGISGYMAVPIAVGECTHGVLSLGLTGSDRSFSLEDLVMAEGIAQRMAFAIERSQVRQELQAAQAHAHALASERSHVLGQIADGVLTVDQSGRIVFINEAAHRLHGGVEISSTIQDYVRTYRPRFPNGQPLSVDDLEVSVALQEQRTVQNSEWMFQGIGGEERIVLVSAAPILAENGQSVGAVMTMHDITAQRAYERHRDEFIASVSHDVRMPLTSIKGWAQILIHRAHEQIGREDDLHALEAIIEQARRMQRLLDEMLDASRLQMDFAREVHRQHLDLVALVRHLVEEYQGQTRQHRVLFNVASSADAFGHWDPDGIQQIMKNLIGNAITYSPEGGDITVTVLEEDDSVTVSVSDEGIGIPPDAIEHVFDQFYRADNVNSLARGKTIDGLGLGLYGAQNIAHRLGGSISVESEEGRGSTFTVVLPRLE